MESETNCFGTIWRRARAGKMDRVWPPADGDAVRQCRYGRDQARMRRRSIDTVMSRTAGSVAVSASR